MTERIVLISEIRFLLLLLFGSKENRNLWFL